jgi:hypothetical protein
MTLTTLAVAASYRSVPNRLTKSIAVGTMTFFLISLQSFLSGVWIQVPFTTFWFLFYGEWTSSTFAVAIALPFSVLAAVLCGAPRAATE